MQGQEFNSSSHFSSIATLLGLRSKDSVGQTMFSGTCVLAGLLALTACGPQKTATQKAADKSDKGDNKEKIAQVDGDKSKEESSSEKKAEKQEGADSGLMGGGKHQYRWVSNWMKSPVEGDFGPTHGEIVVDSKGLVYLSTDTEKAVMVFKEDGSFLKSWGEEFKSGIHGMMLNKEGDEEFIYGVVPKDHLFFKSDLDGKLEWKLEYPKESKIYEKPEEFNPTSVAVAPDGSFFIADGYGKSWIHKYDKDHKYLSSFGGPGDQPGKMKTPHGVWVDRQTTPPTLLVADRGNSRLQSFDLDGKHLKVINADVRRPCKIQQQGDFFVVPDLKGRVTILDREFQVVQHLGDNPDQKKWANYGLTKDQWQDGLFSAPHSAVWDAKGNLLVMDWNKFGRVNKLERVATVASAPTAVPTK